MQHRIEFQGPLDLKGYNRTLTNDQQPSNISPTFIDAMFVRESVFVHEQGVPITMEADSDDCRSCHFIAYSTPSNAPVGTLRLVPFPHDPHPLPGSRWDIPTDMDEENAGEIPTNTLPGFNPDRVTSLHNGKEAYIKLGRWAVVKEFRGQGLAKALVDEALTWALHNPQFFDQDMGGVPTEQQKWNGLVCVHAQKYVADGWQKMGFAVDELMGEWTEAGIPHVGMWRRLEIQKR